MVCAFSVLIRIAYCNGKAIIQEGPAGQLHTNSVFCTHFCKNRNEKKTCTKMISINRCYKKQKQYPDGVKSYWEGKIAFFAPLLANIHD